jgi:hypothetical protein
VSRGPLAAVVAVAVVAVVWVQVALVLDKPLRQSASTLQPTAVVWGNRVFSDVRSLRRWLMSRGESYSAWSRTHPQARAILEHRRYRIAVSSSAEERAGTKQVLRPPAHPSARALPASKAKVSAALTSNLAVLIWIVSTAVFVGLTIAAGLAPRARPHWRVLIRSGATAAALALSAYFAWAILGYRAVA